MDSTLPPYTKSGSVSRSRSGQENLGATADALLRVSLNRGVSSPSTLPLVGVSPSRDESGTTTDAMLRSSLAHSLSRTSITSTSVSRSNTSQGGIGAAAEAMLRSSVPRSFSSPTSPVPSTSVSRSNASQTGLGATAEAMLRSPLPRSFSSSASFGSTQPPSYHPGQQYYTPPMSDSHKTAAAASRPRPSVVGSAPGVAPALPGRPRNSGVRSQSPPPISAAESKRRVRQMQSAMDKASAKARPRNTKGLFKAACSTDLLFLLDTTGSMKKYINAAKNQIRSIMAEIQRVYLGESVVRVAVVGYKDHCNSPNVEFLDFTTSMDQAREFLGNLRAGGGEGWTADALGGIWQASNATWMQQTRCIIHIADAPAHSRVMHDMPEAKDNKYYKPGSEPHGLMYDRLIKLLVKLNINYTFLNIRPSTDRMVMAFSREYDAGGADSRLLPTNIYYEGTHTGLDSKAGGSDGLASNRGNDNSPRLLFQELPMGIDAGSLHRLVLKSVTDSVTRTSSRQSVAYSRSKLSSGAATQISRLGLYTQLTAVNEADEETAIVRLEAVPPRWNSPGWLDKKRDLEGYCPEVVVYSESSLADMMASDDNIKLSFVQLTVHARSTPFERGAQRVASYARIAASASRFVVKSFTSSGKGLADLIEDMRIQALCKAFALEFNGLVRPEQSIDFVVTAGLQSRADSASGRGEDCLSLEPYLAGNYVKYNSNGLYVKEDSPEDPFNRVAQAFSHFTFERSWGHFMVVDLQGVDNLLTDPAIHTLDPNRFKLNDLNCCSEGFKYFFALHECNQVCRQLELVSNRDMYNSGNWSFRQQWPAMEPTVCCSNKFCQSIIRLARAHKSPNFPGCGWCDVCWPQLQASMARWICAAPGDIHEFDVCRFFYESQGKLPPRKCPEHVDKDLTVASAGAVGGGLWRKAKIESKKTSILGNEY